MAPRILLLLLLFVFSAFADPIGVTGTGTYTIPYDDNGTCSISLSGPGVSISWSAEMPLGGVVPDCASGTVLPGSYDSSGFASIDGLYSQYFSFSLGPDGELTLYNSADQIIGETDLIGYYFTTSPTPIFPNDPYDLQGQIGINANGDPLPEPASLALVGLIGLPSVLLQLCRRRS